MSANIFQTQIEYLKGVGPQRADLLKKELGLFTCGDLVNFFPFRYVDKTKYYKIAELRSTNSDVQVVGRLGNLEMVKQKRGSRLVGRFFDDTGEMELVWFQGAAWQRKHLRVGEYYVLFGRPKLFNGKFNIAHPELELLKDHEKGVRLAMLPVYSSTEKLDRYGFGSRAISRIMLGLMQQLNGVFMETLSPAIMQKHQLMAKNTAMINVHFPQSQENLAKAQYRLKFEELFFIQLTLLSKKLLRHQQIDSYAFPTIGENFNHFYKEVLPFDLTGAQKKVLREIRKDVLNGSQMNRLVQGDVGSGKTVVALMSMFMAIDNGFQACMMAPTEILAKQHYEGISEFLEKMDVEVALLTGSTRAKERRRIHEGIESGSIHILVGTHALLEDKVKFKNLGLAVIDEQHRFGVKQRSRLWKKNTKPPHILVMTATPIPRTLAMSLYGDLDVSVIDELPPGRKPIETLHKYDANRLAVFKFMKDEIAKGRQIYVVYPLIEGNEKLDYKDLEDGHRSITDYFTPPNYRVSMVHGKMKPEDKETEMNLFAEGKTQIMVATTVIEVGVNVPNASVMVIESAERFGLSQLHQLRGRVGRGAEQSYCILMTGHKLSKDTKTRISTMVETNDGFKISEVDLKLRGPGDIMGTQQSGVLDMQIADIVKDSAILTMAREEATQLLHDDPQLNRPENASIKYVLSNMKKGKITWSNIS